MIHKHFDQIDSTQNYLKDHLNELIQSDKDILISAESQNQGRGRLGNSWTDFKQNLAFSFTLAPNEVLTLTPLEISVHIVKFFREKHNVQLKLKWPNDLINNEFQKCGGILMQNISQIILCGIGVNLFATPEEIKTVPRDIEKPQIGSVFKSIERLDLNKSEYSIGIYKYILSHRLTKSETCKEWNKFCAHLNKKVSIITETKTYNGIFLGLGPLGEAIIQEENGNSSSHFSGTLLINEN